MNPKHLNLNELLNGRLFRIPEYQRAYAWGSKQRSDLFGDLREVQELQQDHFMATIVCLAREKRQIVADEYQVVEVVDGQQRLTTLIILMKTIAMALDDTDLNEKKIKREFGELFVKGDDFALILLQTNHDSSNIFVDFIRSGKISKGKPKTEADKNLVDAMLECDRFTKKWMEKASLVELVAILKNRLSIIYHEMTDEPTVYRVFEVLNSRGLDVKWIDKLKSQLMALIFLYADDGMRVEAIKEMHVIWQEIYQILGLRGSLGDEALRIAGTILSAERPSKLLSQANATDVLTKAAGDELKKYCRNS